MVDVFVLSLRQSEALTFAGGGGVGNELAGGQGFCLFNELNNVSTSEKDIERTYIQGRLEMAIT